MCQNSDRGTNFTTRQLQTSQKHEKSRFKPDFVIFGVFFSELSTRNQSIVSYILQ